MKKTLTTILKRYKNLAFALLLAPIFFLYIFCLGVALTPAVAIICGGHILALDWSLLAYCITMAISIAIGAFAFGLTLLFVVPAVNWALRLNYKPWRGNAYAFETVPWYYHNALTYLVRYTVLDFINPTPLNTLFYRMMGMKMGKNVHIASTNISDPCMIEMGDNVYVGGSATIIGHYSTHGDLVLAPVKIRDNTTIGLRASIMGDTVISEGSVAKAHSVVFPGTVWRRN